MRVVIEVEPKAEFWRAFDGWHGTVATADLRLWGCDHIHKTEAAAIRCATLRIRQMETAK